MPELQVTRHAIERYQERVEALPWREAEARLLAPIFAIAAEFGARYVRFPTGQRAVIIDYRIVTILPREQALGCLAPARDHLHESGERDG